MQANTLSDIGTTSGNSAAIYPKTQAAFKATGAKTFALQGCIVTKSADARAVWRNAIKHGPQHIVAQALSVARILEANGQ